MKQVFFYRTLRKIEKLAYVDIVIDYYQKEENEDEYYRNAK